MFIGVKRIFLMLGAECNLQCKYCLQHEMADVSNKKVSAKVIEWVATQARRQSQPIMVTFYGGEPLVHWTAITDAVNQLAGKVNFNIITNGKLLDETKVDYCNEHNIRVAVSYDGKNVLATRGYDALNSNPAIVKLNHLVLSAVMSKYTYPKDFLDSLDNFFDDYYKLHGKFPSLNIDTIMDFGNCNELREMDLAKISDQMQEILNVGKPTYGVMRANLLHKAINAKANKVEYASCGNGVRVWNVDTEGNIYRCHNCGEKLGTIDNNITTVLIRAGRKDPTPTNYEKCQHCAIYPMCKCGCPLIDSKGREEYYCDIKRAYFTPVMDYVSQKAMA